MLKGLIDSIGEIEFWSIFLAKSKTDQEGKGIKVFLTPGNTTTPILHTLLGLLLDRAQLAENQGKSLQAAEPLLSTSDGTCLDYDRFQILWKLLTKEFNTDFTKFSPYSHRKGGASDLLKSGFSLPKIRILGRWSNGVQDYYFRLSPKEIVKIQEEGLLYGAPGWHSATDRRQPQ